MPHNRLTNHEKNLMRRAKAAIFRKGLTLLITILRATRRTSQSEVELGYPLAGILSDTLAWHRHDFLTRFLPFAIDNFRWKTWCQQLMTAGFLQPTNDVW